MNVLSSCMSGLAVVYLRSESSGAARLRIGDEG